MTTRSYTSPPAFKQALDKGSLEDSKLKELLEDPALAEKLEALSAD